MNVAGAKIERAEGLWKLPEGWAWANLGELGIWTGGGTPSKANLEFWRGGSIPWVSPKDMKSEVIGETEDWITAEAVSNSAAKYVSPSSVLMVMRSGILRHTFPVAINDRRVTLNQDLRALTPQDGISAAFVARYLRSASKRVLTECAKDGTTVNSIEVAALERLPVPIAPTNEQRRIVERIDALFAEIAEGEAALAEARKGLDLFRRSLLKAAVTGDLTRDWRATNTPAETGSELLARLRFAPQSLPTERRRSQALNGAEIEPSDLPKLPESWAWAALGEISEIVGGVTVDQKRKPREPVSVPYLRVANVQRGRIDLSAIKTIVVEQDTARRLNLLRGDILLNEGGDRDKIGRGWVWDRSVPNMIHQNHVFRARLRIDGISPYFVSHFANELGRRFFMEQGKQTTNLASISLSKVSQLPVPLPPPSEVEEILKRLAVGLNAADDAVRELDEEAADGARLRQSILKAAFEGRVVPQDPNDEPATALLQRIASASQPSRRRGRPTRELEPT